MKYVIDVSKKSDPEEILAFLKKMQRSIKGQLPQMDNLTLFEETGCLHNNCSRCHGTGVGPKGDLCSHFISCRCAKCSPRY